MSSNFKDIDFPETLKISSSGEMIPLEFFGKIIPISKKIQFKLGFFSSNSISTLAYGFARFIFNGGTVDFVINHFVSRFDFELLNDKIELDKPFYDSIETTILNDLEKLGDILTKRQVDHFFNCLRYLLDQNRITITPVTTKNGEISHYKEALFWDYDDQIINIVGSCNFTYKGIVCNGESFILNRSWGESSEKANIKKEVDEYKKIFGKKADEFVYLEPKNLIKIINQYSIPLNIQQLLEEETTLLELAVEDRDNDELKKIHRISLNLKDDFEKSLSENINPKFPYSEGPRDYQINAYRNWKENNFSGVFAMATGTGKTLTALNCLLNVYQETKAYQAIILVPSIALLDQWEQEVAKFNFSSVLKVGGGNDWERSLASYVSSSSWGAKKDLIIISTYGSFITERFQKYFRKIQTNFLLIADEAHNIAAPNIRKILPELKFKMLIGLSATPKRIYDIEGTDALNVFFNDLPPYTYSFSIDEALHSGYLTEYKYFPVIVKLTEAEMQEYIEISIKLMQYFDSGSNKFKDDPIVEILLLKRKQLVHKASNKIAAFQIILKALKKEDKLKYVFAYVPEGNVDIDGVEVKLIDEYIKAGAKAISGLKMNSYTSSDQSLPEVLKGFSDGKINVLFAMKMLDEGVDIPRAEIGVFCSSTGNPRQFIQRRGRLLRKHPEKSYATIYDLIVVPEATGDRSKYFTMEKNLVKAEIQRVAYFASLSMNFYDTKRSLESVLDRYELNLDEIINEL